MKGERCSEEQLSPFKKTIHGDVAEIKKWTQYMSDCFDVQKQRIEFLKEIKQLREENKSLKDSFGRQNKCKRTERKRKKKLQWEFQGRQKNPKEIIKKIINTLKPETNENDIDKLLCRVNYKT